MAPKGAKAPKTIRGRGKRTLGFLSMNESAFEIFFEKEADDELITLVVDFLNLNIFREVHKAFIDSQSFLRNDSYPKMHHM